MDGTHNPATRLTDPNYYGHWQYGGHGCSHDINSLPDNPDFFQIINYATNEAVGVNDPNRIQNTFNIGAALIDLYDGDDLNDPDPNYPGDGTTGNTITIIDYGGASYAYGIEAMSYDDPNFNLQRPPLAPNPLSLGVPANYVLLNRRFENVGEFGYAYNPASTLPSKTLDFASATSHDRAILDFFTYNEASPRAGMVNLNTRNGPVLASIIKGAWLHDPAAENPPPDPDLSSVPKRRPCRSASHCSRDDEHRRGAWSRVDSSRCCPVGRCGGAAVPGSRSLGRNKADDRTRLGRYRPSANLEPDDRRYRANWAIRSERPDLTDS